jgi:hypothetical protein
MKNQFQYCLRLLALSFFLACLLYFANPNTVVSAEPLSSLPFKGWLALDYYYHFAETDAHPELVLDYSNATVEAWIWDRSDAAWPRIRIVNGPSYNFWYGYYDPTYESSCLKFEVATGISALGGFSQYVTWCEKLDYTSWLHVAAVFDGDNDQMRLYVGGNLVASHGISPDDEIRYGRGGVAMGGNGPEAGIDEVRISDIVRYTASFDPLEQAPFICDEHTRALWHFDETEGSVVFHDSCGHDNILTGMNGAQTVGNHLMYLPIERNDEK